MSSISGSMDSSYFLSPTPLRSINHTSLLLHSQEKYDFVPLFLSLLADLSCRAVSLEGKVRGLLWALPARLRRVLLSLKMFCEVPTVTSTIWVLCTQLGGIISLLSKILYCYVALYSLEVTKFFFGFVQHQILGMERDLADLNLNASMHRLITPMPLLSLT